MKNYYLVLVKDNFYIICAKSKEKAVKKFKSCNNVDNEYEIKELSGSDNFRQIWSHISKKLPMVAEMYTSVVESIAEWNTFSEVFTSSLLKRSDGVFSALP